MSRYGTDRVVRAEWWDADEDATFTGKLSFLQLHRVSYYRAKAAAMGEPQNEQDVLEQAMLMCRTLQVALVTWRLREKSPTYEEAKAKGIDRAIIDPTIDQMIEQPLEDIAFMYREMFPIAAIAQTTEELTGEEYDPEVEDLSEDQRRELKTTDLTEAAKEAGLTKARFPDVDANPMDLSRRRRTGTVQSRGRT